MVLTRQYDTCIQGYPLGTFAPVPSTGRALPHCSTLALENLQWGRVGPDNYANELANRNGPGSWVCRIRLEESLAKEHLPSEDGKWMMSQSSQSSVPGGKMEPISLRPSGPLADDRLMNEDHA